MKAVLIDLTGQQINSWTVIKRAPTDRWGGAMWECQCVCGNQTIVSGGHLRSGASKSCGCLNIRNLTNQRFNRLVALYPVETNTRGRIRWHCQCDCGKVKYITGHHLLDGTTQSCGCLAISNVIARSTKHNCYVCGQPTEERSVSGMVAHHQCFLIYGIWNGMNQRCTNPNHNSYHLYGGRGITVCPEWRQSFHVFYQWLLKNNHQPHLALHRTDNDKGYSPDNCVLVTREKHLQLHYQMRFEQSK